MLSDTVESIISQAIDQFDDNYHAENNYEKLLGLGELVEKLSITNFKLYTLKNEVIRRKGDEAFCAWASEEDVKLCRARGLLKNCIDDKLRAYISREVHNETEQVIGETKLYG